MLKASNNSIITDLLNSFEKSVLKRINKENEFGQLGYNDKLPKIAID